MGSNGWIGRRPGIAALAAATLACGAATAAGAPAPAGSQGSDGAYVGHAKPSKMKLRLRVADDGRTLRSFTTMVAGTCYANVPPYTSVRAVPVQFSDAPIRRSGRFDVRFSDRLAGGGHRLRIRVKGRLVGRKIEAGKIVLRGECESRDRFAATRRRR